VGQALGPARRLARRAERRQDEAHEHGHHADDDQQLDEGERAGRGSAHTGNLTIRRPEASSTTRLARGVWIARKVLAWRWKPARNWSSSSIALLMPRAMEIMPRLSWAARTSAATRAAPRASGARAGAGIQGAAISTAWPRASSG